MVRQDRADIIYRTVREKDNAIVNEIEECWRKGQPVLVGTRSIEKSEQISAMLRKKGIPHQVLNAKYHELEAQIIAGAGAKSAVTIATNMAGRGTDIVLGAGDAAQNEEVKKLGGLHIIGTERHESRRIDNQLRGRAGRQGDPGSSTFFLSTEDELMRLFGTDRMSVIMQKFGLKEGEDIQHPWISKAVESAQRKVEGMNFDIRKQLIDFDNVMNKQREAVYRLRNAILEGEDISETIKEMMTEALEENVSAWTSAKYPEEWEWANIEAWLLRTFAIKYENSNPDEISFLTPEALKEDLKEKAFAAYEARKEQLTPELMSHIQRMVLLQMIDSSWKDHLYELDQLRKGIGFRAYAQKDPKIEYQKESFALFESMMKRIRDNTVEYIFKVRVDIRPQGIMRPSGETRGADSAPQQLKPDFSSLGAKQIKPKDLNKIGRNDPCPCGSGKKYKKCCGAS
jgi:preprotein translocase subunit SecA